MSIQRQFKRKRKPRVNTIIASKNFMLLRLFSQDDLVEIVTSNQTTNKAVVKTSDRSHINKQNKMLIIDSYTKLRNKLSKKIDILTNFVLLKISLLFPQFNIKM